MNHLTRSQFVLLVILVSFVTSIFTGIVTATLVTQAPLPMTQTINRVIEKTIETVIPGTMGTAMLNAEKEPQVIIVSQEDLVIKLVEDVSSAVVSVVASKDIPIIEQFFVNPFEEDEVLKQFFGRGMLPQVEIPQYRQNGTEKKQVSGGTGFFVSSDGFLLTNKHVVADKEAEYSIIMNDGSKFPAKVLARNPMNDIAILKVDGENFNFIPLANSSQIKVGQTVVAIGNALGEFQNTVSIGIVSGLDRSVVATGPSGLVEQLQKIIQTDAAVNLGNSGGPLLDLSGRVIGINTAVAQGAENVGFALPIDIAKKDVADVKEFGEIRYAYLGVRYLMINTEVQKERGLAVDYGALLIDEEEGQPVMKDSPAEKVGLKNGDIILEFNKTKISVKNILSDFLNVLSLRLYLIFLDNISILAQNDFHQFQLLNR